MKKLYFFFILLLMLLNLTANIQFTEAEETNGSISFQPNIIPETSITFDNSRFVFDWLGHHFEVAMFLSSSEEFELEVEENKVKLKVKLENGTEIEREVEYEKVILPSASNITWGINIPSVPEEIANYTDSFSFKIVGANFNLTEEIEAEEVNSFVDLGYNITRFHLPDNLVLSYEDLWLYDLTVSHPNKHETIVKGVKGKTEWNLDPITFSGGIITVIGGTEGSELDFIDIWNEHESNGTWNVMNNTCNTQFKFWCRIVFGNDTEAGTTWFADEDVQVYASSSAWAGNYQNFMYAERYANIRLGKLIDPTDKTTENGVSVIGTCNVYGGYLIGGDFLSDIKLYGSFFAQIGAGAICGIAMYNDMAIYECLLDNMRIYSIAGYGTFDAYRVTARKGADGFVAPSGTFNDIVVHDYTNAFHVLYGWATTVKNVVIRDCTYAFQVYEITSDKYVINGDIDNWNFNWLSTSTHKVYRQYEFDIHTIFENQTDISNCNVSLTDVDGIELFNIQTDANGEIAIQTVTYAYYNQTGGDNPYLKSPHTLKVFKEGVRMYQSTFNITEPIDLILTLSARGWHMGTEGISFQQSSIPKVSFYYQDYSFYLQYKEWYLRLRPFAIYNEELWNIQKIVEYLKNQNASYTWAVRKTKEIIHWGFNITGIPEHIAANLNYLGFKIIAHNIPLSEIKLENVTRMQNGTVISFSRIWIPKANLGISFEDLIERGFTIKLVNKTYILIGNVNQTFLDIDPVVYSDNTITVTGFTEENDSTFQDICDVNDENGWGVVDAIGNNQFLFDCKVVFGDGSTLTYFEDLNAQVTFSSTAVSIPSQALFEIKDNATFILGQLDNTTTKTFSHGCSIISNILQSDTRFVYSHANAENITIGLYDCSFIATSPNANHYHKLLFQNPDNAIEIYGCSLDNSHISFSDNLDIYDIYITRGTWGFVAPITNITIDQGSIKGKNYGFLMSYANVINTSNMELEDIAYYPFRGDTISADSYFTDCSYEAGGLGTAWIGGTGEIYILYSFDLTFTFPNGSYAEGTNVTISNAYLGTSDSWILPSNGSILQQTYIYGHYNQTGGNTIYDYNPYLITATLDSYHTYSQEMNITKQEDLTIALQPNIVGAYGLLALFILIPLGIIVLIVWMGKK